MSGLLDHLTVIEVASPLTEWCGRMFAQAGARVILVEPPGGAETRSYRPFDAARDRSLHFEFYHTDKESHVLDLADGAGRDAFRALVAEADFVIEGWSGDGTGQPGAFADDDLMAANPRLTHIAISPFGRGGPWNAFLDSDLVQLALGGQMKMCGYDDQPASPPIAGAGNQAYHMGGTVAFIAGLSRQLAAAMTGEGGLVDVAVHDACSGMTEGAIVSYDYGRGVVKRQTGRHANVATTNRNQFRAADGRYVNARLIHARLDTWRRFVAWMAADGMEGDLADPAYEEAGVRNQREEHILEVMERFIATKPAREIFHGGQERGLVFSAIHAPQDLLADEHLAARGFWVGVDQLDGSPPQTYPGTAFLCDSATVRPRRRAPLLGEHQPRPSPAWTRAAQSKGPQP